MSRTWMLFCVAAVALAAAPVAYMLLQAPAVDAQADWLAGFDALAAEFSGEIVVENGTVPLEGPRRMVYYEPKVGPHNPVRRGAIYGLHISGNPEVVIAIEDSVDAEDAAKTNTYIEISRLSGAAINISRKGEKVATFPRRGWVDGAYMGCAK